MPIKFYGQNFNEKNIYPTKGANGKYGFNFNIVNNIIPYHFDWASDFDSEGYASVCINRKYGIIDRKGKAIIPLEYDYAFTPANGLAAVIKQNKFGAVNINTYQEDIPCQYDALYNYGFGTFTAFKNNKWGVINNNNKILVPFNYTYIWIYKNQYIKAIDEKGNEFWFSPSGKSFIAKNVDIEYSDFLIASKDNINEKGIIDSNQEWILPPDKYQDIDIDREYKMATITKNGKTGLFSLWEKKWLYAIEYDSLEFANGSVVSTLDAENGPYYFMDLKGNKMIPTGYDEALPFSKDKIAKVKKNGLTGFINSKGEQVVPFEFVDDDTAAINETVEGNIVALKKSAGWGMFDKTGKIIIPFKYKAPPPYGLDFNPFDLRNEEIKFNIVLSVDSDDCGLVKRNGEWFFRPGEYKSISIGYPIIDGYLSFDNAVLELQENDGKRGVWDVKNKQWRLEPQKLDGISGISIAENAICYLREREGNWGYYMVNDKSFHESKVLNYEDYDEETDRFVVSKANKFGLIDRNGKMSADLNFEAIRYAGDGLYFAIQNTHTGYIDKNGKTIIPFLYDLPEIGKTPRFSSGKVFLRKNKNGLLIDVNGKVLISDGGFKESNIVEIDKKSAGQIDFYCALLEDGNQKILLNDKIYRQELLGWFGKENFSVFNEGLMPLSYNGKYGYIDIYGNVAIDYKYDIASPFENGLAIVKEGNNFFIIDRLGKRTSIINPKLITLYAASRNKKE